MNKKIDTIIKLGIAIILIIAATTRQQYSYYTFIRWAVMISYIYFTYKTFKQQRMGLAIYFSLVALLFNPFIPFWFQKETWHLIDYIVATITLASIYFDWKGNTETTA
jgi:hypothetical protein